MTDLTHAAVLIRDRFYVEAARASLETLNHEIEDGGVRSSLLNGSLCFEGYPAEDPDYVLNAYLNALIGVISLNRIAPGEDRRKLLEKTRHTLEDSLHLWDVRGWSTFDLHNHRTGQRNPCLVACHRLQVMQLRYLGTMMRSPPISRRADIWERSSCSLPKKVTAGACKIGYRLRRCAQR